MNTRIKISFCLAFATSSILIQEVKAQTAFDRGWSSLSVNIPATKKLDVSISHLRAYDLANGSNDFNQTQLRGSFDITKRTSVYLGGLITQVPGSTTGVRKRVFVKADYKMPVVNTISWTNGIQGELNSANETRYKYRVNLQSRVGLKKRLDFLNLAPSISYSLYYNIGGSPIQYYDQAGIKSVKQTPDGFHRGRMNVNLNSKISNSFSITAYLLTQREFNLMTPDYRKLNVIRPVSNKITREFDDFNAVGLSLAISLDKKK
jgi:hypothetical protein